MMKHNENDFAIPALKALYTLGGKAMMSDIKDKIPDFIDLWEGDLVPFISRTSRKESRYRQVVGNIISHHNDVFFRYAFRNKDNSLTLTEEGRKYVTSLLNNENKVLEENNHNILRDKAPEIQSSDSASSKGTETDFLITESKKQTFQRKAEVNPTDGKFMHYAQEKGLSKRQSGDTSIRDTVLEISEYKCQYAKYVGEKHPTFKREDGHFYVEGHHLIPLAARKDFFPRNLDRASNLICLCPTCHEKLHHGSKEVKAKMLSVLYDKYIQTLNEEQIYITFDELMSYYGGGQ